MPHPAATKESSASTSATLTKALAEAVACSVSLQSDETRIHRPAKVVDVGTNEIRVELAHFSADAAALAMMKSDADLMATVCLRVPEDEIIFFSRVGRIGDLVAREGVGASASQTVELVLAMPLEIIATRRRQNFRVAVADEDHIELKLWRIDNHAVLRDQPKPSQGFKCALCDLSASGLRAILWAGRIESMGIVQGQRFRVQLKWDDDEMVLDARLRHPRSTKRDQEFAWCGFEFILNEDEFNSRRSKQKLEAILAKLQRAAAKRLAA